jgi:DNA polymerase III epsilon subunit-like protein
MSSIVYYSLDLETNGLVSTGFHEICELSILRVSDRVQLTRQVKVERPENSSLDALKIIKKTAEQLRYGINKSDLIEEVERFVNEDGLTSSHRCLIGHNIIAFDRKFLWSLWEKFNMRFPFDLYLDTFHMAKDYAKKMQLVKPKLNLIAACELFDIKRAKGEHNAKSDTRNCYLLYNELIKYVDYHDHITLMQHKDEEE